MEISNNWNFEDDNIGISSMSITYSQNPDTCSDKDDYQEITISTRDNGVDFYYDIETNSHWSISNKEEFVKLLKDFESRFNLITK